MKYVKEFPLNLNCSEFSWADKQVGAQVIFFFFIFIIVLPHFQIQNIVNFVKNITSKIGLTNECSKLIPKIKEDIRIVARSSCFVGHDKYASINIQKNPSIKYFIHFNKSLSQKHLIK